MPWHVAKSDECPASKPWAVIKDSDGSIEGCHATQDAAEDQMAALYASEEDMTRTLPTADWRSLLTRDDRTRLDLFEQRCGNFGGRERRALAFADAEVEIRDSGEGPDAYTVKGHAAVFGRKSLDLGGFQEIIAPSAFDAVLDRSPHVLLLWDHDTRYQLASTKTNRLELRIDPRGLHYWARVVGSTSHARDLRYLMDAGEVDQSSFAFTVTRDTWEIKNDGKDNETVLRTIEEVGELFDVTITAMGAYPQTDSSVVRVYAKDYASTHGRLPNEGAGSEEVAPEEPAGTEDTPVAPEAGSEERQPSLMDLRREAREQLVAAKTRYLQIDRRLT